MRQATAAQQETAYGYTARPQRAAEDLKLPDCFRPGRDSTASGKWSGTAGTPGQCLPRNSSSENEETMVPGGGIEPPRAEARRILSPLRLPVPPSRLRIGSACDSQINSRDQVLSSASIVLASLFQGWYRYDDLALPLRDPGTSRENVLRLTSTRARVQTVRSQLGAGGACA